MASSLWIGITTSEAQHILELVSVDSTNTETDLQVLADELLLPRDFLYKTKELLDDKKQIIFQGPPGTGKTYVAQKFAESLAESKERVTLVQFHPSYAYEDFVQGFRPTQKDGQLGFALRDGPLLQAAERARNDSDEKQHFLIIDEINRGNLAKILGELYFLLEYRDEEISLQYSDKRFSLPDNLSIIGTMNTADRSIALVDLALRRRFYFVEFHPDRWPIKGFLSPDPPKGWMSRRAKGVRKRSIESGIMGLKTRTNPRAGALNRCYHLSVPTASESPSTIPGWWPMPGCSCRPLSLSAWD